jgi:hypothetical protein
MIIYCIEDINDLKYVGKTKQKLYKRLASHKSDKRRKHHYASSKLNLYNCIIYPLEECEEEVSKERERYWINKIDCVNIRKFNGRNKDNKKDYDKVYRKEYRKNMSRQQKDINNARRRELRKLKNNNLN